MNPRPHTGISKVRYATTRLCAWGKYKKQHFLAVEGLKPDIRLHPFIDHAMPFVRLEGRTNFVYFFAV